jgi:hypothetical protein
MECLEEYIVRCCLVSVSAEVRYKTDMRVDSRAVQELLSFNLRSGVPRTPPISTTQPAIRPCAFKGYYVSFNIRSRVLTCMPCVCDMVVDGWSC